MKHILNTEDIKTGDILLAIPTTLCVHISSDIEKYEDHYKVQLLNQDVESFSEEIKVVKCILVDNGTGRIYVQEKSSGETFVWDKYVRTKIQDKFSWWVL